MLGEEEEQVSKTTSDIREYEWAVVREFGQNEWVCRFARGVVGNPCPKSGCVNEGRGAISMFSVEIGYSPN